ncbi:MAG: L-seryl-tRNA(Sec) selenium transferase [Acidobacteria bacterium]|nr:MAG: L-seryl-tRNA(Sec) selenium transferase [Acidobacteriota bacterium]REK07188.1 MAG: L-seryl-tRNA(Sec) selenium transferase [Acidobacteriota bacterium]
MSSHTPEDPRRTIPPVSRLLADAALQPLVRVYGVEAVTVQVRAELEAARAALAEAAGRPQGFDVARLAEAVERRLVECWGDSARRVINATGVFLHTNLGRAPLDREVIAELLPLLDASTDVELDLGSGRRSDRNRRAELLLAGLVGAESALVVNNNAAAIFLILAAFAGGASGASGGRREVVVSRGELVEIGGSFRIPDILAAAGARLVEVGTTNRTRLADYRRACGPQTALLLKVHPSNYRVRGFTSAVSAEELVGLGRELGLAVVVDEGSGLLRPSDRPQLRDHSSLSELVASGVTLACGSGDKLLGGPQAGLICGGAEPVATLRRHPLYRALRPSRQVLVALESTLRRHLRRDPLPIDRLWDDDGTLAARLERMAPVCGAAIEQREAFVGGGAAPDAPIPGPVLVLHDGGRLAERLRRAPAPVTPVLAYVRDDCTILDLRTVDPRDDDELAASLAWARGGEAEPPSAALAAAGSAVGEGGS